MEILPGKLQMGTKEKLTDCGEPRTSGYIYITSPSMWFREYHGGECGNILEAQVPESLL